MPQLYLASTSPRRRELLAQIGVDFEVLSIDVHEQQEEMESAEAYVRRVALDKARAGWSCGARTLEIPLLAADTEVVLEQRVLGKPRDREHALQMLRAMSGRAHEVLSAVALIRGGQESVVVSKSVVHFREIGEQEMAAYWATGEPADKAGGYAIQGLAALFVSRLEGSFSGVMGLPLYETAALLQESGINLLPSSRS